MQWRNLKLFDQRHVTKAEDMFEAVVEHIKYVRVQGWALSAFFNVFNNEKFIFLHFLKWR